MTLVPVLTRNGCDPISSTSVEPLWVPLASTPPIGPPDDLPGLGATVDLAFVPVDEEPGAADWHPATWAAPDPGPWPPASGMRPAGPYYLAELLVGPGHVQLDEGWLDVWARLHLGSQHPEIGPIARLRVV
jgi:hypothetical protein